MIAIIGPTATGKTAVAVTVARRLGNAELINADSRQVVRGLVIGTCSPTTEQLQGVACHLLALRDPGERFTVADWLDAARTTIDGMEGRRATAIVAGGTGLYIDALLDGFQVAGGPVDQGLRERRESVAATVAGRAALSDELCGRDPDGAADVDLRNPRRVIRALEILDAGQGSLRSSRKRTGGRDALVIGLDADRPLHDRLIESRVEAMIHSGALVAETRAAVERGVDPVALESSGIGYTEALALLNGTATIAEATESTIARTRRYAKAQRTWFRRRPGVRWLSRTGEPHAIEALADQVLAEVAAGCRPL